ncbi:hypothetical protein G7046_g2837 [Stylonectria norvegica]|nr:hypothetical protein G7046_g2837 [Stylonectria norvegica]
MTATSVASSSQMFSAFGQPTRSPSPAFNPFASNNSVAQAPAPSFGFGGASNSPSANGNKFGARLLDANLSDSSKEKNKRGDARKKKGADWKASQLNGDTANPQKLQNARAGSGSNPFQLNQSSGSRPTSSSSTESPDYRIADPAHTDDPHARKVYERLRQDGISPPQWPSQPGNPKNKAVMTKFREQYEEYRTKVRVSLTKAGLIDDPEKRRTLQDAIDFKGICEDMCPEYEKITRITEMDVHGPEKNPQTKFANTRRMVKKLARSAAGQEAPLPMDVRSASALRRTLDYLMDSLLQQDDNLPTLHGFLWDRTRAIRRDFTFFSSLNPEDMKTQVYVLENIARFHVTALHLLSQEGNAPEDFVEQQELEQLGKSLLSLRDAYDDCNVQGITCENEAEFRAYYLIFHAYDSNIIETLQRQWKPNLWRDSDEVRTAVSLVEALQNTQDFHGPLKDAPSLAASSAYHSYFRIVEDAKVSYTMACFAECHFPHIRRSILTAVKKALARPKVASKDVTAAVLNKFLRFDTVEEAIEFAELHDLEFGEGDDDPSDPSRRYLIFNDRKSLPHHRLQHQFSRSLVEKKRGSRPLPDLIHHSVFEDPNASTKMEGSLFVSNTNSSTRRPTIPTGPKTTITTPFSSFAPPSGSLGGGSMMNSNQACGSFTVSIRVAPHVEQREAYKGVFELPRTTSNGTQPNTGTAFQQPPPKSNPFAPTPSTAGKIPVNSFATANSLTSSSITNGAPSTSALSSTPATLGNFSAAPSPFTTSGPPTKKSQDSTLTQASSSSFFSQPQTTNPSPFASFNQGNLAKPPQQLDSPSTSTVLPKAPDVNPIPPTPQSSSSPFGVPKATSSPFSSGLGAFAPAASTGTLSETGTALSKPPPFIAPTSGGPTSVLPQAQSLAQPPQLNFPPLGATKLPSTTNGSSLGSSSIAPLPGTSQVLPPPIAQPQPPKSPPRDLVGDFTKWFVQGDSGLLEDFKVYMISDILQDVFDTFQVDEEKKRRKEEEEEAIAKADSFRVYNLSVRYFYRWREIAREKRLSELRRSGRDQMRLYHDAQRAAEAKAHKQAARQAAREKAERERLNRPEELMDLLKHKKVNTRQAANALLASGVLSGVRNEQEAVARIVTAPSVNGSVTSQQSRLSQSSSREGSKGGSKTQALRDELLQSTRSASFRRSLPPMSSRDTSSPDPGHRTSRVSERWRLKAMGIVQLPDGTAVPESLANEMGYGKRARPRKGSMGPPGTVPSRRASLADATHRIAHGAQSSPDSAAEESLATKNKRKRPSDDDGKDANPSSSANAHKRVMSDAATVLSEMRAMREEMEEGASWFREQNERLQTELHSRGSTPWEQNF